MNPSTRNRPLFPTLALLGCACVWAFAASVHAGQFKRITIDGSFDDWLGVPVAETDDVDANGEFDIRDVSLANDEAYLYIRIRMHAPSDYAGFHHQVLVDTDADGGTGHAWGGVGSELFVENGSSYQQKNGQFNEGAGSNLDWQVAPRGSSTQFEMRLSRSTLDAEGLAFFAGDEVAVSVLAQSLEWQLADSLEGLPYTFATQPEVFAGMRTLTDLQNTFWFYQEVGDPEPDWLLPDYLGDDTWQGAQGFFSFGFDAGTYPVDAATTLAPDRTTYYFRTPFLWENAAEGVALLAEAHLSDGAVIYLNGDEVRRIRMPEGPIDGSTFALSGSANPGQVEIFSLPAAALITGENLLMVEMHQAADSLDSLAFGLTLIASDSVPPSLEEPDKPADREVVEGEGTRFELGSLAGTEPYTFQWYKDERAIPDANGAALEIPVVLQSDAGAYYVEVSNASGSVRSRQAELTTSALPVVLLNEGLPADQTLTEGEALVLGVEVQGSPLLSYQWYKNDFAIDFATEASLRIASVSLGDAGDYSVTVSNRLNTLSSRKANVAVQADERAPRIESVTGASGTVHITFSEILDADSALDVSHYQIAGLAVRAVSIDEALQTVTLETDAMAFGQDYRLTIASVEDRFGNGVNVSHPFRATILIDGDFADWAGIAPLASEESENAGIEFKQFWIVNDAAFLYLRFSFHTNIGQLPVDHYYQIFLDGDNDPATGLSVSTLGSTLMIENGNGWLQAGGGFNEGSVPSIGFLLAPEGPSSEFECRIALSSNKDGTPLLTADTLGIAFNLISTSWEVLDSGPAEALLYPLVTWPPLVDPGLPIAGTPPTIRRVDGQIEILWEAGLLESSDSLLPDSWTPVPNVSSPHRFDLDGGTRFYRSVD